MPELPEVETVARGLLKRAIGRRVAAVEVLNPHVIAGSPDDFTMNLTGRSLQAIERKGKALAIKLGSKGESGQRFLLLRLGMTGQVTVASRAAPLEPHTHVRIVLDDGREEVRYRDVRRFGRLRCCTREELEAVFDRLGPDAQQITESEFSRAMRGRSGAIKSWLMNQQLLAGLGNIYADEALFAARIHPLTQPGRVPPEKARRLFKAVKKVLDRAVKLQGTSFRDYIDIEGRPGSFRMKLRVYQRTGQACRRCGEAIRRIVVAGRSSHFCPQCQPRPRQAAKMGQPRHLKRPQGAR
ncbi:MAG TPA: bifunctional DNA-formamidopyrimidine glycosylase/DNA-(apurinic or apyrimidinic site) lyase [Terriglobia bacterium]|jgi:formamidopyrimidine-DNA glycosylase|nr:bifunctional DNA-formamidopyrimidine glycosylase/DNA-(apurinic or apyrimidinic site) lyase [Terriglobia bacterium]